MNEKDTLDKLNKLIREDGDCTDMECEDCPLDDFDCTHMTDKDTINVANNLLLKMKLKNLI